MLAAVGLLLMFPAPLFAQDPVINFEHITLDDGLSDNTVYSIAQDTTGFLWFGTQNGLNKFDGYTFTVYKHDPFNSNTVSNDNAGNIFADRDGLIWIGTWGGGLDRFDPKSGTFTNFQHSADNPTSLSHNRVQTIFQDSSGTIWVGTAGGGLNKFNAASQTFTRYQNQPGDPTSLSNNRVWRIAEDLNHQLWIATSDGLNRFDPATETFTRYFNNPADDHSLSHSLIRTLTVDSNGTLWVGTERGLNRFNPQTNNFERFLNNPTDRQSLSNNVINALFEDSAGRFWIGTSGGGLNRLNRETGTFVRYTNSLLNPNSLSYNDVRAIAEDRAGVLWIATRGGGINKLVPTAGQFSNMAGVPGATGSLSDVRAIFQNDDGSLWIGTRGGGVNIYNPQTGENSVIQADETTPGGLSSNEVYAIFKDRDGIFWLGTSGGGLNKYNPQTGQFTTYHHNSNDPASLSSDDVNTIYQDHAGNLWIGTKGGGLNRFDPATETFTVYRHPTDDTDGLNSNDIYSIYQDQSDQLWIGYYGDGLDQLNPITGEFVREFHFSADNPQSISDNNIYHIHPDPSGDLWIATANNGLNRFNPETGKFTRYTQADGLASDVVYSILSDESGNLWLSTSRGISKFNPTDARFVNYDASDGVKRVTYREGAAAVGQDGTLYFGGINGLTSFHPNAISENTHIPPVVLTGFSLFNQKVNLGLPPDQIRNIDLSYQDDVLSFDFAALDFTDPAQNQYAYKLEGFDEDWNYAGTRPFATYTNLDPGSYTFKVKGTNNAGLWSDETAIEIVVKPPFWDTWWFKVLAVLVAGGLGFTVYKLRVRAIQHHRKLLKKQVAQRTAALQQANQHLQEVTDRLQEELALAQQIQQGLLPPARPNWSGLDVVCFSKPALEVGGDFYDYYAFPATDNRRVAVVVGDVSGKGMPAALLMAVSLGSLQSIISQSPPRKDLMFRLDETLRPYTRTTNQNCAFCYAELNGVTLSVLNAGGITPLVRHHADGSVRWLDASGLPLGVEVESTPVYREATLNLDSGDMVILTSDGVIEARKSSGEFYGFNRLEQAVATGPSTTAEAMLNHLKTDVTTFMDTVSPHDDLTIVVMKV